MILQPCPRIYRRDRCMSHRCMCFMSKHLLLRLQAHAVLPHRPPSMRCINRAPWRYRRVCRLWSLHVRAVCLVSTMTFTKILLVLDSLMLPLFLAYLDECILFEDSFLVWIKLSLDTSHHSRWHFLWWRCTCLSMLWLWTRHLEHCRVIILRYLAWSLGVITDIRSWRCS